MIWLLFAGIAAFLLWYNFIRPLNHFTKMGVKQTKPWPFLGDQWPALFKLKSMGELLTSIYNMYPKTRYVGFYQFTTPVLIPKDPELIKQITVKDFDHFLDHRPFVDPDIDPLWSNNLFSLTGQQWKDMRATLSGSFTSSKMKHMFGVINETAENFVKFFLNKNEDLVELDMKDAYTRYTNDIIATSAFGIKVNSLTEPENTFYNMGKEVTSLNNIISLIKVILFNVTPKLFKLLGLSIFSRVATFFFRNVIHETIHMREEKGIVRKDMINLLLEARKGNTSEESNVVETGFATVPESVELDKRKVKLLKLTNDDITSQALIFFFAGFDTISTGLCFGSAELAVNKDIQDRLREEVRETHNANNGIVTYDTLLKMKYMDMVFSEIVRKWPPAVSIDRVCTKPYTIKPIYPDEKPVHMKVGDVLFLPIQPLHRNPKYYPNPLKFDPERFSDENKSKIRPYSYIPFGSGPRSCIGSRFAILEAKTLLYHLLLNFEILPTKRTIIPIRQSTKTLRNSAEGGFWLGLKRIKN